MATTDLETAAEGLLVNTSEVEEAEATDEPQENAPEVDEAAEIDETAEDEAEPETDEAESEAEDEADEESEGDEQPQTFTVKVDGETREVTLDDLTRSYSGQAYIQKGMQEAADARKQVEQQVADLKAEQQRFVETVQKMQQSGIKQPPTAPDVSMLDTDPIGYMQADAKYKAEKAEYEAQQREVSQMEAQQRQAYLQEQHRKLQAAIPEFSDPEKAKEIGGKLIKTGVEGYGFSAEEISAVTDARTVQVLMDAMRWRELQSGKAGAKKKPTPPKAIKPTGRRTEPAQVTRKKQMAAAKKSGKLEDFASLLLEPKNG